MPRILFKYQFTFILFIVCIISLYISNTEALTLKSSSENSGSSEDSDSSNSDEKDNKSHGRDNNWNKKDKGNKGKDWDWNKKDRDWNRDQKDKEDHKKVTFLCPEPHGMFPDTQDCTAYFVCTKNKASRKKCKRHFNFDMFRKTCLPLMIAVCDNGNGEKTTTKVTTNQLSTTRKDDFFICSSRSGNHPYPYDCSKYYNCVNFKASLKTCPKHKLYDGVRKICKPEKEVNCGNRMKPTTPLPPTPIVTKWISTTQESTMTKSRSEPPRSTNIIQPTSMKESTATTQFAESTTEIKYTKTNPPKITQKLTSVPTSTEEPTYTMQPKTTEESTVKLESTSTRGTITTEKSSTVQPKITKEPSTTTTEDTTVKILSTSTEEQTTGAKSTTVQPKITEEPETIKESTTTETTNDPPTGPPKNDCNEDDLDCIIKETGENPVWFKCPERNGSFEHPSSQKLFIFCMNGKPKVKKCGQNLIFSVQRGRCILSS